MQYLSLLAITALISSSIANVHLYDNFDCSIDEGKSVKGTEFDTTQGTCYNVQANSIKGCVLTHCLKIYSGEDCTGDTHEVLGGGGGNLDECAQGPANFNGGSIASFKCTKKIDFYCGN